MKKIKFLHTADIHLDTPFSGMNSNDASKEREYLKVVFKNIIDLALEKNVDIIIMAGDIFDNMTVHKSTISFLINEFERLDGKKVFISPGNHDPFNVKSFYNFITWPDNVYIFKGEMEKVFLEEFDSFIYGAGFRDLYERETLLEKVKIDKNYNNILAIHGEIMNSDRKNEYNPISKKDIEDSGFNYIALGHRHTYSGVQNLCNTYYAYSGCPQGRGFDEEGDKGVIIGEIEDGYVNTEFIKTSIKNYYTKYIMLDKAETYDEIVKNIVSSFDEKERMSNFYNIILKGTTNEFFVVNEDILYNLLKDEFYFIKIKDNTQNYMDIKELSKGNSVKNIFASKIYGKLKNASNDEEKEIYLMALKEGISALTGEEAD
ncbi:DNA repair exonuclease [Clostridium sp. BJN0001]|uniref:metallophosphoesterase family protein n=1 Tax=Clostridium sp. BJN0001 TaxID=2930219 RepID=UPI001FD37DE0|nr:DNA repair exonuclease [Clostridium sp. BJN0001]